MQTLEEIQTLAVEHSQRLWDQANTIWSAGGWAMYVIAIIAMVMFLMGTTVYSRLSSKGFLSVSERKWRRWIDNPSEREGRVGELLDFVTGGETLEDTRTFFAQLEQTEHPPIERDLRVMRICVNAAPLVGLLGTVTGMLATFGALSSGSGGDKTMGMIAAGISEALITTETGLVIALPGLFFQYQLARRHARYKAFLAHLETVCSQVQYRLEGVAARERQVADAKRTVAAAILERVRRSAAVGVTSFEGLGLTLADAPKRGEAGAAARRPAPTKSAARSIPSVAS